MNKESTKEKVLKKLNLEFGNDINNLSKCKDLVKKLAEEKANIETEIIKASTCVSSPETLLEIDTAFQTIDEISKEFKSLCRTAKENDTNSDKALSAQEEMTIIKIQQVEQGLSYLRCIQSIQNISSNIEMYLSSRSETEAVAEFGLLCQMCARLHNSKCYHLKTFLSDTLHHWHNILKDRFSAQFEEVLKAAGWPLVSSTVFSSPPPDALAKFQLIFKHLLYVQLPPELNPLPAVTSSLIGAFPPISLPVTLMLKPLKKRFIYHFCGNKQTNRPDKPEWYMTQVLTWIRDHEKFLNHWAQPVFNQKKNPQMSAKLEFTQGLVQLVVDKLHSELPTLMQDDALFSHAVDETLGFDKELNDTLISGYPESLPSGVTVLTQAHVFIKWIHMERKYARDKMDAILSAEGAWAEVIGSEEEKVTQATEGFLSLLSTMTERFMILPQPGHRMQFVELQLELIDELRVRLLQLLHSERQDPLESRLPAILNTVHHISGALADWGAAANFYLLHHFKSKIECVGGAAQTEPQLDVEGTVFDQAISLLELLEKELVQTVCEAVLLEVKARSRPYRRDKWFAMDCEPSLTPSAVPVFQVLAAKLHSLQALLTPPLFTKAWQNVATQLCTFLLEELVLQNRFNEGGAKQLEQDLNRSLIPLFHQYTQRPEAYFLPLKEACSLITFRPVPVEWTRGHYNRLPVEVHHLSKQMIHDVIQRRADIMPDLM